MHSPATLSRSLSLWLLLAVVSTVLTVITAVVPHWLETVVGLDLDGGNGVAEWLVVIAASVLSVLVWLRVTLRLTIAR